MGRPVPTGREKFIAAWPEKIIDRFWSRVTKTTSCWNWVGSSTNGYGRFVYAKVSYRAHRASFVLFGFKIGHEQVIDHLCKNTLCVNPKHLRSVSVRENTVAAHSDSLPAINTRKKLCKRGHKLSVNKLYGWRQCETCRRRYDTLYKRKRRGKLMSKESIVALLDKPTGGDNVHR